MGFMMPVLEAIGSGAAAVGSGIGSAASTVGSALGSAGSAVGEGAATAGKAIGSGAGSVGNTLKDFGSSIGDKFSSATSGTSGTPEAPSNFHSDSEIPAPKKKGGGFFDVVQKIKSVAPGQGNQGSVVDPYQSQQAPQEDLSANPQFKDLQAYLEESKNKQGQ